MEGNKNQSQGAKSGECGAWATSWTSLVPRKPRVTAALCALALSWCSSRSQTPVQGRRLRHAWKTLGMQWLTYQSAMIVFLSSSAIVATWPNFARKQTIICLEALLFLLNFTGGFSSGKTHTAKSCFISRSYCYSQALSPVAMSQMQGDLPLSNFLRMWVQQSTLPRFCSSLRLWATQQAQRFLTPRRLCLCVCLSLRPYISPAHPSLSFPPIPSSFLCVCVCVWVYGGDDVMLFTKTRRECSFSVSVHTSEILCYFSITSLILNQQHRS